MWLFSGYIFIQLVLGISSQECRTSNNKDVKWYQTNKPCIFPFKHGEKTHNTCADLLLSGKVRTNMCATKVDNKGVIKGTGKCGPNCPQECITTFDNQGNTKFFETNKPCIFPFKNRGTGEEFNGCADIASFKNVCATKVDGLGNARRIGTCGNGCPRHGSQPARSPSEPSPPKKEELTRSNYDSFRTTLKYEGAGKNSGQYLWIDDDEDNCGQAASKFQHH